MYYTHIKTHFIIQNSSITLFLKKKEQKKKQPFSIQCKASSLKDNGAGSISLYGWGGLKGREMDYQDCRPSMTAVQQGLLAGAAPLGELALQFPWGLKLWRVTRCRGPKGTKQEETHKREQSAECLVLRLAITSAVVCHAVSNMKHSFKKRKSFQKFHEDIQICLNTFNP